MLLSLQVSRVLMVESGHVYTMGNNSDGRLGIVEKENRKVVNVPVLV